MNSNMKSNSNMNMKGNREIDMTHNMKFSMTSNTVILNVTGKGNREMTMEVI